jgi:hypothetical protein
MLPSLLGSALFDPESHDKTADLGGPADPHLLIDVDARHSRASSTPPSIRVGKLEYEALLGF